MSNTLLSFSTFTDFRAFDAAANAAANQVVVVVGALSKGDIPVFYAEWLPSDSDADDGYMYFRPTTGSASTGNGRWKRATAAVDQTFSSGNATPSVKNGSWFITAGTTAITDFNDGYEGQVITVERGSADITIAHDIAKIDCGGADIGLSAANPRATFESVGGVWKSLGRNGKVWLTHPASPVFDEASGTLDRTLAFDGNGTTATIGAGNTFNHIGVRHSGGDNVYDIGNGALASGYSFYMTSAGTSHSGSNMYGVIGSVSTGGPGTVKGVYGRAHQLSGSTGSVVAGVFGINTASGGGGAYNIQLSNDTDAGGQVVAYIWCTNNASGTANANYGLLSDGNVSIDNAFIQYASVGTGAFLKQKNAGSTADIFIVDKDGKIAASTGIVAEHSGTSGNLAVFKADNSAYTGTVLQVYGFGNSSTYTALDVTDSAGNVKFRVRGDGHIGIGTAPTSNILDVNGASKFSGNLGFFGATPAAQPSTTGINTGFTAGSGTAVRDDSTFTGGTGTTAYRINDIVKALKTLGLLAN